MFVINEPAMVITTKKTPDKPKASTRDKNKKIEKYLIIGDLHLGLTSEFRRKGVSVYSQVKDFVDKLKEMKKKTQAENLIMVGDVKHKVTGISWQEEREIPDFLNQLSEIF